MKDSMIVAIVQARMGSSRLPGKVMKEVNGKPLIGHLLARVSRSNLLQKIVLATSTSYLNDPLCEYVATLGIDVFRGEENDVLDRFYQTAINFQAETIVRLTGDCPLLDAAIIDKIIQYHIQNPCDYTSNIAPPTYPDGLDTEVMTFSSLERAWRDAKKSYEREHVTPYIRESGKFVLNNVQNAVDLSAERWTVDEIGDFIVVKNIIESLSPHGEYFGMDDVLNFKRSHSDMFLANQMIMRNEGSKMNSGQKLWTRAKSVIAGGNSLLSKRPDMFLPGAWPCYFDKAKGINVWDLDGNRYVDMSIMGIGTNVLGYGCEHVDNKVSLAMSKGNMSTLNCPEEVFLAEKLIELHPWADMVRFSRTGGEACAMAVRIARAASGKDTVAFCGYHGWHDWYLSSNIAHEKNLDGQLLPGLKPKGVPRKLAETAIPFTYNNIEEFEHVLEQYPVGVVIMEPVREHEPQGDFLQRIRELTQKKNIVLIFDEVTAGFRREVGGIHKAYGVYPDMAVLGKAMGNGYAISAVIGKKNIMECAQDTFISSTFWTDRIGPVAALATIEVMQTEQVPQQVHELGKYINECWSQLGKRHNLDLAISSIPALTHFSIVGQDNNLIKTIITQEMLKKGYLAGMSVYVCRLHQKTIVDEYIDALDGVFGLIRNNINNNSLATILDGPVCHQGFKRLT
jgi:glutamate-1-semialdehyde aminotransferase/spore coat polysaccharide biosynthesis protein SpsF (cytidylyltransferase family)